jgi:hypothetical protein
MRAGFQSSVLAGSSQLTPAHPNKHELAGLVDPPLSEDFSLIAAQLMTSKKPIPQLTC